MALAAAALVPEAWSSSQAQVSVLERQNQDLLRHAASAGSGSSGSGSGSHHHFSLGGDDGAAGAGAGLSCASFIAVVAVSALLTHILCVLVLQLPRRLPRR